MQMEPPKWWQNTCINCIWHWCQLCCCFVIQITNEPNSNLNADIRNDQRAASMQTAVQEMLQAASVTPECCSSASFNYFSNLLSRTLACEGCSNKKESSSYLKLRYWLFWGHPLTDITDFARLQSEFYQANRHWQFFWPGNVIWRPQKICNANAKLFRFYLSGLIP